MWCCFVEGYLAHLTYLLASLIRRATMDHDICFTIAFQQKLNTYYISSILHQVNTDGIDVFVNKAVVVETIGGL